MFSRVLKSTNAQPPTVPAKEPSSSPTKRSAHTRTKSSGASVAAPASASPAMASPSKIPVPTTPSSRAAAREAEKYAKENVSDHYQLANDRRGRSGVACTEIDVVILGRYERDRKG